jgi:hypothetical protein
LRDEFVPLFARLRRARAGEFASGSFLAATTEAPLTDWVTVNFTVTTGVR